ncbi:exodeoxyribonuclease III [Melampsora americana]|nr:exodeoxyribonuclease III [Melampsora americana]
MGPKPKSGAASKSKAKAEIIERDEEEENVETTQEEKSQPVKPRKRKAKDKEAEDTSSVKPTTSKAKKAKGPTLPLHSDLPNNKVFPSKLEFNLKAEGCIRISAWNVCGVNACDKKGLKTYLQAEDPDIMIMSETKMQAEPDIMHLKHQFRAIELSFSSAGVAILSKYKPLNVVYGLPTADDQESTKGRMIMLEFMDFHLIGTYTPNAGEGLQFMTRKNEWNVAFEKYLRDLDCYQARRDINCALTEKDLRNATTSWNKIAGYTQDECDALHSQLNPKEGSGHGKLVDAWRVSRPDLEGHYTYRFGCREKGIGWRIDSFYVSERVLKNVKTCEIRQECYGASDHVPVILEIELNV